MTKPSPIWQGQFSAFFKRVNQPRGRTSLRRLTRSQFANDSDFLDRVLAHPWPDGTEVEVRLHVHNEEGRLFVGRMEILSVPETYDTPYGVVRAPDVNAGDVLGTELLRMVKFGELSAEAVKSVANDADEARMVLTDEAFASLAHARDEGGSRRGRPSLLTPTVLEVVRDAYNTTDRAPTKAVQEAMELIEFPGSGPAGEVTRDQAAKAVQTARRKGYLPPTSGRRR